MRRRLLVSFLGLAAILIALFGVPRAFMVADIVRDAEEQRAARMAHLMAEVLDQRQGDDPVTEQFFDPYLTHGESVRFRDGRGTDVTAGSPVSAGDIIASERTGDGVVTFRRSEEAVDALVVEAVAPLLAIGAGLLLVSWLAATLLARRLSRPFVRLAEMAREVGRGQRVSAREPESLPEARAVEDALRESAETLERRIRREHEFAANASHQLRTPVTALRLELEDLTLWPQTPPDVREQLEHALREIDRLADAITHLLQLARGDVPGAGQSVRLDELLRGSADRWQAQAAGRRIRIENADGPLGWTAAPATQILDVLVHNALTHGHGDVTLSAARRAQYVTIRVADEGARPTGMSVFERRAGQRTAAVGEGKRAAAGEGIGLALSAQLAESLGGHLLLESDETTTFTLRLPARD